MTEENKTRDQQTKQKQEGVISTLENSARWTLNKLNSVLSGVGISKIDTEGLLDAIKAGTIAPNSIVGAAEELLKMMAGTLKAASRAAKSIPWFGSSIATAIKLAGKSLTLASHLVDRVKDACVDLAVSHLAWSVGNLQDGLNDVKDKLDKQGKAMEEGFAKAKAELEAQGAKHQEAIDDINKMMNEFKSETAQHLAHVEGEIENLKTEQNRQASQLFDQKLEFGRLERELTDKMKNAEENVEYARQEMTDHRERLQKAENNIDRSVKEGQQQWEEFQSEWQYRENILKSRVEQYQDQVDDYQQEQARVKAQQDQINLHFAEIEEQFEQQGLLLHRHIDKMERMADDMEEIATEVNKRMDKIQKAQLEQDDKIEEINFTVKKATKDMKEALNRQEKKIDDLEEKMKENQEKIKQAKSEADRANERIDNLLTNQSLSDFSESEKVFQKLEKVLEQKAEEAKLLANLETLRQARKEFPTSEDGQEWLVGILKGREKEIPRPEGYPLIIPQRWIRKYGWTPEELREWGWDVRLQGEHESAPLTTEDKRQERKVSQSATSEKKKISEQREEYLEKIENTKAQILERLAAVQEQISSSVEKIETSEKKEEEEFFDTSDNEQELAYQQLAHELASKKQNTTSQAQQDIQQKWGEFKELSKVAIGQKKPETTIPEPEIPEVVQKMVKRMVLQNEIGDLQQELKQSQNDYQAKKEEREQLEKFLETKQKELEQSAEGGGEAGDKKNQEVIKEEINDIAKELEQSKKEESKLEQEVEKKEKEQQEKEEELEKIVDPKEELEKEKEKELSASQKTMTFVFLLIIIFLLEYIVYKRNGLPGLVVLNIILGIIYYYKDTLKECWKYVDKYLLIIAYIMGNVLAYNCVEDPNKKWPIVIAYNAIIAAIYGYTWWQENKITEKIKKKMDELFAEEEKALEIVKEEQEKYQEEIKQQEAEETKQRLEAIQKLKEISHSIAKPIKVSRDNLKTNKEFLERAEKILKGFTKVITSFEEAIKELEKEGQLIDKNIKSTQKEWIKQWKEISQQGFFTQKELEEIKERAKNTLFNHVPITTHGKTKRTMTVEEWKQIITPLILEMDEIQENKDDYQFTKEKFIDLLRKTELDKEEEKILKKIANLLSQEQIINISSQSSILQAFIKGEVSDRSKCLVIEIEKNYSQLSEKEKLVLLSLGLKGLGIIDNTQKKQLLTILNTIRQERNKWLNHIQKGNQNLGELLFTGLKLTEEQEETLRDLGLGIIGVNQDWNPTRQQKEQILNKIIRPMLAEYFEENEEEKERLINLELPEEEVNKWQVQIGDGEKYPITTIQLPISEEQKLAVFSLKKLEKTLINILPTYLKTIRFPITLLKDIFALGIEEKQFNFLENNYIIPNTKTDFISEYEKHLGNSYREFKTELLKPIYQKLKTEKENEEITSKLDFLNKHRNNYHSLIGNLQEEITKGDVSRYHEVLLPLFSKKGYSWDELLFPGQVYQIKNTPSGVFLDIQFLGLKLSQKYHLVDILLTAFCYSNWTSSQERILEIIKESQELQENKQKLYDLLPEETKRSWLEQKAINPQYRGSWKDFKNYLDGEIVSVQDDKVIIRPEKQGNYDNSEEFQQDLTNFCDSLEATLDKINRYHHLPNWKNKSWEELIRLENSLFGFKTNQKKLNLKSYQQLGLIYQGYLLARKTEALLGKENERKIIQKIELEEERLKQLDKEKVNCQRIITIENIFSSLELTELFIDFLKDKFTFVEDWEKWRDISLEFTEELVFEWTDKGFDYETTKEWIDIGLKPTESHYAKWLRDIAEMTPEEVLNEGDGEELRKKYNEYKEENQEEEETEDNITFAPEEKKINELITYYWISQKKKELSITLHRKDISKLLAGQSSSNIPLTEKIKGMFEVLQEQLEKKLAGKTTQPTEDTHFTPPKPETTIPSQEPINQPEENQEEEDKNLPEWLKKQRARKKKQLEEQREQLEQDRKIADQKAKEAEEKLKLKEEEREQKKIEEENRRKKVEAEQEQLRKNKIDELENIAKNTEIEAQRAKDKLEAFIKEEELKTQRMEQKIKDLIAETEAKKKAYAEKEKVLKEQHQKELDAIAADDLEKRQNMEKEFQAREEERQRKHAEEMRKIKDEKKRKEDEFEKNRLESERKIQQAKDNAELSEKHAKESKRLYEAEKEAFAREKEKRKEEDEINKKRAEEGEKKTREDRRRMFAIEEIHEIALDLIMEHQPFDYDMAKGTLRNGSPVSPRRKKGTNRKGETVERFWKVKDYWNEYSGMKINPYRWRKTEEIDFSVKDDFGNTYIPTERDRRVTRLAWHLGDKWYTKSELEAEIKKINTPNFFDK